MSERFLYHSFPRRGANGDEDISKGLKVLKSINDHGLLLTPENLKLGGVSFNQFRVCFTDLAPKELLKHATVFGAIAIEFDFHKLTALGAIPVRYLPNDMDEEAHSGEGLAKGIKDLHEFMNRIWFMEEQLMNLPVGFEGSIETYFGNTNAKIALPHNKMKEFVNALKHGLNPINSVLEHIATQVSTIYPTGSTRYGDFDGLGYYRQREWRIVPGGNCISKITQEHKREVMGIDPEFFGRPMSIPTRDLKPVISNGVDIMVSGGIPAEGPQRLIDHCYSLRPQNGIWSLARRVICPTEQIEVVRAITGNTVTVEAYSNISS